MFNPIFVINKLLRSPFSLLICDGGRYVKKKMSKRNIKLYKRLDDLLSEFVEQLEIELQKEITGHQSKFISRLSQWHSWQGREYQTKDVSEIEKNFNEILLLQKKLDGKPSEIPILICLDYVNYKEEKKSLFNDQRYEIAKVNLNNLKEYKAHNNHLH